MGNALSALEQMYLPKAKWGMDQIRDLMGQVMIVTGGATGVGKETVMALLTHNAKVYIATRNEQKANAAIEQLKESTGKEASFLHLDLADLASVKKSTQEFLSDLPSLPQVTTFSPNLDLLPVSFAATESGKHGKARVVTTSSSAVYLVNELKYETFREQKERRAMATYDMYNLSKFDRILYPAPHGAPTQLWGGTAPETADYDGKFLIPWARLGKANPATEDPKPGENLWNWLEEQVKTEIIPVA
ncbi:hypothetical protein EWM64_g9393 [Hericium alpestre]|uniref:Ketoreductase (KR) domain-containing protein n=1 Tax=Hericium alpestre TaxID=135208 RepID=A0A4Y9ZMG4_9AGAM|nr:hypothetical protein EWM64_g9393 [Hericium alpestre]